MRDNLNALTENKEQSKTFSIPIKKEIKKLDTDSNKSVVRITSKIKFIIKARFMTISLSNLVDKLAEEIHKIKC